MKEKTAVADGAKSKLQEELKAVRTELASHRSVSEIELNWVTASYNKSTARLNNSKKECVEY